jgi:hypothetical protein
MFIRIHCELANSILDKAHHLCTVSLLNRYIYATSTQKLLLVQVATWSKVRNGLGPLDHWDRGFELHSRHEFITVFFCVMLSCADISLEVGHFSVRGVLTKSLNGFTDLEVNSDSGQARGPNPWNTQKINKCISVIRFLRFSSEYFTFPCPYKNVKTKK